MFKEKKSELNGLFVLDLKKNSLDANTKIGCRECTLADIYLFTLKYYQF